MRHTAHAPLCALVRILGSAYHARGADIAFFSRGRIPKDRRAPATAVTPDLVIEIRSPADRVAEVQAKVRDRLRAGVRLLWYVDPVSGGAAARQGDQSTACPLPGSRWERATAVAVNSYERTRSAKAKQLVVMKRSPVP